MWHTNINAKVFSFQKIFCGAVSRSLKDKIGLPFIRRNIYLRFFKNSPPTPHEREIDQIADFLCKVNCNICDIRLLQFYYELWNILIMLIRRKHENWRLCFTPELCVHVLISHTQTPLPSLDSIFSCVFENFQDTKTHVFLLHKG